MKRCTNPQVFTHRLESCVWAMVQEVMTEPSKLQDCLIGYKPNSNSAKQQTQNQFKIIDQKVEQLSSAKKNAVELYATGELNRIEYSQQAQHYDSELKKAKNDRAQLLATVPGLHKRSIVEPSLRQYCNGLKARLENSDDFDSKRKFCLDYIEQIVFTEGRVRLYGTIQAELNAYADPEQTSEARKVPFVIESSITPYERITRK